MQWKGISASCVFSSYLLQTAKSRVWAKLLHSREILRDLQTPYPLKMDKSRVVTQPEDSQMTTQSPWRHSTNRDMCFAKWPICSRTHVAARERTLKERVRTRKTMSILVCASFTTRHGNWERGTERKRIPGLKQMIHDAVNICSRHRE